MRLAPPCPPTSSTPIPASGSARARARARARLLALLIGLLPPSACGSPPREESPPVEANSSRVDVYLAAADPGARAVEIQFGALELEDASGARVALEVEAARLASTALARRTRIGGGIVPPGEYAALVLRIARATGEGPSGPIELRVTPPAGECGPDPLMAAGAPPPEVRVPLRARVLHRDALSLFLDWQVCASLRGAELAPRLSISTERPRVSLGLLYATDERTSSVLAVDRGSSEVVATYKTGERPRALALARDRRRLYTANAGDGSASLLDVQQGALVTRSAFGLSAGSHDVVLADFDRTVAVSNRDIDKVALLDARTGLRIGDVAVGRAPTRLAAAQDLGRLFVLESGADSVAVVDVAARAVIQRLTTEARPVDLAVDRRDEELYVVHASSPNLLVFGVRSLTPIATIYVGPDASAVLADRRRERIYVARSHPAEVLVVDRRLASVLRRIPISAPVEALAQPVGGNELYGASPRSGSLIVVDLVLGREQPAIPCGGRPTDVLVAD